MKNISKFLIITGLALTFFGCQTVPKNIPEDLTSSQLLQRGQDFYANANYKGALTYYNTCIQRYGTDAKVYIEARYEIAHTYLKIKDYRKAKTIFLEILETFENNPQAVYMIPAKYKKLSQIQLDKINSDPKIAELTADIQ